ncbi:MAG TPA: acetyl-CoA C-acyltransferase [Chromatiaceae bacterium]|jgi:acetyl-CoA C-acetyltransferase|nr:MAG: beta-ketothiolase BktB [Thiohalocapsa sp. PB-PSB1]HBG96540.1 acetyl-CoA C-acyltransferase [Chromatiaceae bacterium]HCS91530.1 acetyl-CoA C-acyltransferase [Chromatiaceae bacterium]
MSQPEIVFLSGVRTAIGDYGGSLKDFPPTQLAAMVVKEAVARAGVDAADVGACVFGNVIHTEPKDMYMSRVAALDGGLPQTSQAFTLNRLCGSGLQAICSAAQQIMLGDVETAVAGGSENMSRSLYSLSNARWGQRMGDGTLMDMMVGALSDPFDKVHMGMTAENVAERFSITREDQDALAVESHQRAAAAQAAGRFKDQILPVELKSRKGTTLFEVDEHVRGDVSIEGMAKLRTAFKKDGTVTPGNASGINDAAAAVVVMSADVAKAKGLKSMARLVGYAVTGVDPQIMGMGPVSAVQRVMERTGLSIGDMDVIELNEAFAAQALACARDLELDPAKVNPNGSGISLGHPIGATGAILMVKALYELQRVGGRYALISMCIGGGQGIAAIIENSAS